MGAYSWHTRDLVEVGCRSRVLNLIDLVARSEIILALIHCYVIRCLSNCIKLWYINSMQSDLLLPHFTHFPLGMKGGNVLQTEQKVDGG